jgi:FKBP-type peptidyl-prolyl cis-trans isomerase
MAQGGGLKEGYLPKSTRNQILNEADNGLKNERLNLAMARTGGAHTATSQFFINDADNAFLNHVSTADDRSYGYCVFGKVVDGVDAYESIINAEVKFDQRADRQKPAAALETITITEVVILDPAVADAAIAAGAVANLAWEEKQAEAKANALNLGIELVAAKDHDVSLGQLSDTGLWTLDVVEGEGRKPALTEKVKVHYTGWVDNGMKFDSSHDRGLPMTHPVNRFVPGFTEGLSGMKIGGTRFFVIPYELGYGAGGNPAAKIPPRTAIVFEVELLDIIGS